MRGHRFGAATAALLSAVTADSARGEVTIEKVALTGEPAPGTGGAVFRGFSAPVLNEVGSTAFLGTLRSDAGARASAQNDSGLWSEGPGALALVAREGDPAPGVDAALFDDFDPFLLPALNKTGRVAFTAALRGPGVDLSNDRGLWAEDESGLELVMREGEPAPGGGLTFQTLRAPVLNEAGQVAFMARLDGDSSGSGWSIWSENSGELALVARTGSEAQGSGGAMFSDLTGSFERNGRAIFHGRLHADANAAVGPEGDSGLWAESADGIVLVARGGDRAPGTGDAVFAAFDPNPVMNGAGQIAFSALLTGSGVDASNQWGIWTGTPGDLNLVVRSGDDTPGTSGAVFSSFSTPRLNEAGQIAFAGTLQADAGLGVDSSNDDAIWVQTAQGLALVAQEGAPAPGAGDAVFDRLGPPALGEAGQVVFWGALRHDRDAGIDAANDDGIWVRHASGLDEPIIREGDSLEVGPGDVRPVRAISATLGAPELGGGLAGADNGRVTFQVEFTDGSEGVFVAELGAPPSDDEPPEDGSPDDGSPDDGSPDDGSPDDGSPDDGSPEDESPDDGPPIDETDGPYPPSDAITGISFDWTTHQQLAPGSDNWPITWAANDHQYTAWGDGGGFGGTNQTGRVSLGFARVEGPFPDLRGVNVWGGVNPEQPATFKGKSYGVLALENDLYMWRCGEASDEAAFRFQELHRSTDGGQTWQPAEWRFPESIDFYCPTFAQFGKGYAGAPDEWVYMYAAVHTRDVFNIQIPGRIVLFRAPKDRLLDRAAYEFFTGLDDAGNPSWSDDVGQREPVFEDDNGVHLVAVSYNQQLDRYFLTTGHQASEARGNLGIFEAEQPWGPWRTVLYEDEWGAGEIASTSFFWNFSPKWWSGNGEEFVFVFTGVRELDAWNTVQGRLTVR